MGISWGTETECRDKEDLSRERWRRMLRMQTLKTGLSEVHPRNTLVVTGNNTVSQVSRKHKLKVYGHLSGGSNQHYVHTVSCQI